MSKVSGTYASLSRGVSQQAFESRIDGQHGEQVNMWSDPVHGLTRRRGTILQYCKTDNLVGPSYHQLATEELKVEYRNWIASFRTVSYTVDGKEFEIHYPSGPKPSWISGPLVGPDVGVKASLKSPGSATVVVVDKGGLDAEANRTRAACALGFSGVAQIGRHLLLYPNQTQFPAPIISDAWASVSNGDVSIEVKRGVPNRTYTVRCLVDGVLTTFSYTTPSSSYSGTLDTSDIAFSDPEYQKKVNDRVNAYNDAVTKWITTAANQTRPQYIVEQLALQISPVAAGVSCTVNYYAAYMVVYIANGRMKNFTSLDGGDGSQILVNERTVSSLDKLSQYHKAGKIMQVRHDRGEQAFYMRAVTEGSYLAGKVRWEECPRTSPVALPGVSTVPWLILSHNPVTGKLGIASGDPAGLLYLSTTILAYAPGDSRRPDLLPAPNHRLVGDDTTSPTPAFYDKQVTSVGMFQDRLYFAAGGTINFSEVGNYFNFWRTQTLTAPGKDPVEVYALGSEADIIRHGVIFDRSLLLFGDKQQYSIDGRNPLTPSTSTVIQSSAIEDATDAPPVVGRELVFFAKRREGSTEVFQMEVGDVSDTSRFTGLGLQLSDYLEGTPAQLLYVSSPSILFVRTSEKPHSLYVFKFIDQGNQRIMDSWSRFDYHEAFGLILGMFYHNDSVCLRVDRQAIVQDSVLWTGSGGAVGFEVLERQSLLSQVPDYPYIDSIRPGQSLWPSISFDQDWTMLDYPFLVGALAKSKVSNVSSGTQPPPANTYWLHGEQPAPNTPTKFDDAFSDIPTGEGKRDVDWYVVGLPFDSYADLTSPVRRDQNGNPIMQGRMTVGRLEVYYTRASGVQSTVTSAYGEITTRFNGRLVGNPADMLGVVPVTSGVASVTVGRETRSYVCRIAALGWLPLSVTRITWTGQWFMNHRFV